ncbi:winged helix DNA-binding domain-containing protein [soil metagenome]
MKSNSISKEEAITLALTAQGFNASLKNGKSAVLNTIRRLGYIQLDTLSVVTRAHHHTLWTRTEGYKEDYLFALMREKKIFEYWSHAAAYLPMEDFRFSLIRKNEFLAGRKHWFAKDKKIHQYVLDKIKAEGPLQSRDFETDKRRGSWFDWKPAKIALEQLFQDGTLMVTERKGFQKVYDLSERVLPPSIDTKIPTEKEYAEYLIRTSIKAHGLASSKDMTHLRKGMQKPLTSVLKEMCEAGKIIPFTFDGKSVYYQFPDLKINKTTIQKNSKATILSPFDNAIIRRERLMDLFEYDFCVEFYLPEHKRKYGYFCMPVLFQNKFIGRFDAKADRASGVFYVKHFYLENKPEEMQEFLNAFAKELKSFSTFNGCEKIVIEKTSPGKLKREFTNALLKQKF